MKRFILVAAIFFFIIPFASAAENCTVYVDARSTDELLETIPSINDRVQECEPRVSGMLSWVVGDGASVLNITNDTHSDHVSVTLADGLVTNVEVGVPESCTQVATISQETLDMILAGDARADELTTAYKEGTLSLEGCTMMRKTLNFLAGGLFKLFG